MAESNQVLKRSVLSAQQVSAEYWIVRLRVSEEGKTPLDRDFVVTIEQLAFLRMFAGQNG